MGCQSKGNVWGGPGVSTIEEVEEGEEGEDGAGPSPQETSGERMEGEKSGKHVCFAEQPSISYIPSCQPGKPMGTLKERLLRYFMYF